MCGFAGILTSGPDLALRSPLAAMVRALRHRGPDDEGIEEFILPGGCRLGLAHTRLSILDLSSAGHQPMSDPRTGSCIAYNGEVFNHRELRSRARDYEFRSHSDTETLLAGWIAEGDRFLQSLRGMFAFAMYDAPRRRLWLVRDRMGIKPLYIARVCPQTWVFASEVRAILASGLIPFRVDRAALEAYLTLGAVPAPWTLVQGIQSLTPAQTWCFHLDRPGIELKPDRATYWKPPFERSISSTIGSAEAVESLRQELVEAVEMRMLSDVPVGVFLSGGIDSSAIVAILAARSHRPKSFCVTFDESKYDESRHSLAVAKAYQTEHHEIRLSGSQVLHGWEASIAAYDQPSIDGTNTYFICKAVRDSGIKVALSGLGGDELFAGYKYFRFAQRVHSPQGRWVMRGARLLGNRLSPGSARLRKLDQVLDAHDRVGAYIAMRQVMGPEMRTALLGDSPSGAPPLPDEVRRLLQTDTAGLDPVNAHSVLELSLYMANMLLRDTDQMSMAHALEVRVPLLDHRLIETVAALPGRMKLQAINGTRQKALLQHALPLPLPLSVRGRKKMGFVFPWERWLRKDLHKAVGQVLNDRSTAESAGLRPDAVAGVWRRFLENDPALRSSDVLCLVHLLMWSEKQGRSQGAPSIHRAPAAPALR